MDKYVVPAGSIMIERNPEVVKTLDPEKVAVVVYIDDKPGSISESTTGVSLTEQRPAVQTRPVLSEQPTSKRSAKAEKKLNKEREEAEKAQKKSSKEAEKAQKKSNKEAEKAQKESLKEQKRQAKKH